LRTDIGKVLDHGIGLSKWRQVTVAFSAAHKEPEEVHSHGVDTDNEIRGHSNMVAETHYANDPTNPVGIGYDKLWSHLRAAHWGYQLVY
jgi:hypothetical protein